MWSYCIQINKEAGFMVHSWIKEVGLTHLSRRSLCMEEGINIQREKAVVDVFTHTVNTALHPSKKTWQSFFA